MKSFTLVNGRPGDSLSVHDRGLAYGDGLFDTLLVKQGRPQFFELHLARLLSDCRRLGLPLDSAQLALDFERIFAAASELPRASVKTLISRGVGLRGYAMPAAPQPSRVLTLSPLPEPAPSRALNLMLCDTRLGRNNRLAGIKHLNRLENVLARSEWRAADIDEGLLLDSAGLLVEGTMSNIFWLAQGRLFTPRLSRCGVAGVMRQLIIERLAPGLGLAVRQGDFTLADLYPAEEVFMCNSLMGIRPVAKIGCHHKTAWATTMKLQQALELLDA